MKKNPLIFGCGTALITPFKQNLEVDYSAFKKLVKRQIDAGIHFLVPLGTTGEAPCLEDAEKIKLINAITETTNNNIPIVAGIGSNCTKQTIKNLLLLEQTGVDAFLVITPYYNKPTQSGLYNHFKAIAESTDKSIIMYNVPNRTGTNMSAETCLRLAEISNIIATKEASSNISQINEIICSAPTGFYVFSGNDSETLALMAMGAKGVISVAANIVPTILTDFVNLLLIDKYSEARIMHTKLTPLFKNCFIESNPIPVKAALHLMKLIDNTLRPPLYAGTEDTIALMKKTLDDINQWINYG